MAFVGWALLAFATGICGAFIGMAVAVLSGFSWGGWFGSVLAGFFGLPIVVGVALATTKKGPPSGGAPESWR